MTAVVADPAATWSTAWSSAKAERSVRGYGVTLRVLSNRWLQELAAPLQPTPRSRQGGLGEELAADAGAVSQSVGYRGA